MAHHSETLHKIHPLFGILLLGLFVLLNGCGGGGDSSSETPSPTITSFVQTIGHAGDTVIITGTNFDTLKTNNTVKFSDTTAVVDSSSATQIKAFVPVGATTGKISVTVSGKTATSTGDFTVTANTPVFAGYYYDDTLGITIPCYWDGIGGTATRHPLPGDGIHNAYAYSTILASDGNEYTAGHYFNGTINIACYWKGTTRVPLQGDLTSDTSAFSITESDGIIYVSGYYYNSANDTDIPCYWTITSSGSLNRTDLDIIDATQYNGYAYSIGVYNGTVYTAGYYFNSVDQIYIACYWIGNVRTDLGDGSTDTSAFSIAVSGGTVYTAGYYLEDTIYIPCYWTATSITKLAGNGQDDAYASSLAVYNGTVYTSGFYSDGTKDIPCYWTGATRTNLAGDGAHLSEAFSIIVSDGTVYTGGSYNDGSDFIPCYWTGTTQEPVEIGEGTSEVISSIFHGLLLEI